MLRPGKCIRYYHLMHARVDLDVGWMVHLEEPIVTMHQSPSIFEKVIGDICLYLLEHLNDGLRDHSIDLEAS